jgi:hypothetical protein
MAACARMGCRTGARLMFRTRNPWRLIAVAFAPALALAALLAPLTWLGWLAWTGP